MKQCSTGTMSTTSTMGTAMPNMGTITTNTEWRGASPFLRLTLILICMRICAVERRTRQRSALDEMLERTGDFCSAQRLHAMLRDHGESISLATVYRTLQSMARDGEVDVLRTQDNESRYRRCLRQEHHHHLVCRQCGHTVEVTETAVERWADRTAREHGFAAVSHSVELQGVCAKCGDTALP